MSKNHDWLHGVKKKPGASNIIPRDAMLDLWQQGKTEREIADAVLRPDGSKFQVESIRRVISCAREEGDPRAVFHRKHIDKSSKTVL